MPQTILVKGSTAGGAPASLAAGTGGSTSCEIAIDRKNGAIYYPDHTGAVKSISGGGGGGSAELVYSYATTSAFPATGDASLLYFATDTGRIYRWTGSVYAEVGPIGGTMPWRSAPATSSSNGTAGDFAYDSSYLYVCTASNVWRAAPITRWDGDPYWSNVALLVHGDGAGATFTDSSSTPKTITAVGSATQSATQSKFGGKSVYCDGTSAYIATTGIGTISGDFAIDFWLRWNSRKSYVGVLVGSSANTQMFLGLKSDATGLRFGLTGVVEQAAATFSWSNNTWYHVAVARASGLVRIYVNGTNVTDGTQQSAGTSYYGEMRFGGDGSGTYSADCYLDDIRVTVGTSRGFTGATIPVPTAAFPDFSV